MGFQKLVLLKNSKVFLTLDFCQLHRCQVRVLKTSTIAFELTNFSQVFSKHQHRKSFLFVFSANKLQPDEAVALGLSKQTDLTIVMIKNFKWARKWWWWQKAHQFPLAYVIIIEVWANVAHSSAQLEVSSFGLKVEIEHESKFTESFLLCNPLTEMLFFFSSRNLRFLCKTPFHQIKTFWFCHAEWFCPFFLLIVMLLRKKFLLQFPKNPLLDFPESWLQHSICPRKLSQSPSFKELRKFKSPRKVECWWVKMTGSGV